MNFLSPSGSGYALTVRAVRVSLFNSRIIAGDLVDELETDETEDQNQEFLLEDDENVNS